jgi:hypothetical protein
MRQILFLVLGPSDLDPFDLVLIRRQSRECSCIYANPATFAGTITEALSESICFQSLRRVIRLFDVSLSVVLSSCVVCLGVLVSWSRTWPGFGPLETINHLTNGLENEVNLSPMSTL